MFDENLFQKNLKKNPLIKTIEKQKENVFKIISNDDIQLLFSLSFDDYHPYYTFLENPNSAQYYPNNLQMPHDCLTDLYYEINRMMDPIKRSSACKYPYFKSN